MDEMREIKVFVTLMGFSRNSGASEIWVKLNEGSSVSDLFEHLITRGYKIPDTGISILLNGRFINLHDDREIKLQNLDRVTIIPPLGGGNSKEE